MTKKIAIQGIKGSFHHIVSQTYFDEAVEVQPYLSFSAVVESLITKKSDVAVMALENSIAGSIIPNYAHIDDQDLHITGEYFLEIQHNLMALKGQSIADINEVFSHPMALLQCKEFFKQYPHIKLIEDTDTAEVAQRIAKGQLKGIAAIASLQAAQRFELNILAESIQTIKHNETRFVIVERQQIKQDATLINKASVKFLLDHKRGSLAAMLNVMSDCNLNLTKIQSLPKIDTPWKYAFFVDITFEDFSDYEKGKAIMKIMAEEFKILGEYKNAKK
ncbi:prephenate dehydratase [Flavobacteriaceae bacterium]|jgi:prephenate dehydratase|nr:prephenate dehydratase [Flavobacteriaceae bacterium]MDC1540643.1 prephenate dehydratase [Flavobacteriaceae bacterium]